MKQKQLLKVGVVLLLVACVLSCVQSVQAKQYGPWEFLTWLDTQGDRIHPDEIMEISASEQSYVWHGYWNIPSNMLKTVLPLEVKLFMDDMEINLKSKQFVFNDRIFYPPGIEVPVHSYIWYRIFEAGYFTPGEYDWRVEFYVAQELYMVKSGTLTVTE